MLVKLGIPKRRIKPLTSWLTYWMNSLQPIPKDDPHFVTLNTTRTIKDELIYDQLPSGIRSMTFPL